MDINWAPTVSGPVLGLFPCIPSFNAYHNPMKFGGRGMGMGLLLEGDENVLKLTVVSFTTL